MSELGATRQMTRQGQWPSRSLCLVVLMIGLRFVPLPGAEASYLALGAYAWLGRLQALQALALLWLFNMLSSGVAPEVPSISSLRFVVFLSAAISVLLRGRDRLHVFPLMTIGVGAALVVHSLLFSRVPEVSLLKALSWTMVVTTVFSGWIGLAEAQRSHLSRQLFMGLIAVLIASLPLMALPVGYLRNGTGFQGILNHPQVLGPTMGLLGAWSMSRMLCVRHPSWFLILLGGASTAVVLMSEARVAGVAMLLGLVSSLFLSPVFAGLQCTQVALGLRSRRVWALVLLAAPVAVFHSPQIGAGISQFLSKSGRAGTTSLFEAYDLSRGPLIAQMQANIHEHPWTGIGFGVASDSGTMLITRDPALGLPVGAAVEKGVAFLAIVEELGVLGAALVGLWMCALLRGAVRSGTAPFAVTLTILFLNMGESTFFSPGGFGLLSLLLLGWAFTCDQTKVEGACV